LQKGCQNCVPGSKKTTKEKNGWTKRKERLERTDEGISTYLAGFRGKSRFHEENRSSYSARKKKDKTSEVTMKGEKHNFFVEDEDLGEQGQVPMGKTHREGPRKKNKKMKRKDIGTLNLKGLPHGSRRGTAAPEYRGRLSMGS